MSGAEQDTWEVSGHGQRFRACGKIWKKIKGPEVPLHTVSDPPFEHDIQKRIPSVEKAKRLLGFQATTTLDAMLDELIPWIEQALADNLL